MSDRFTAEGSPALEARIAGLLERCAAALRATFPPDAVRAVVLIGGYGRGEGGVVVEEGVERLHNNLDLLVIATARAHRQQAALKQAAEAALAPLADAERVAIDIGTTSERTLRWSPCLVMWYDMRHGHRTLLGDAGYVPGLARFTVERIEPRDVRALLVNRASLLLVNRLLAQRDPAHRQAMVRHAMKAVIGCGDALLFALGRYHWSYREKRARMAALDGAPSALRAAYETAAAFRFRPDYAPWVDVDLTEWTRGLLPALADAHLRVERALLARDLAWDGYVEALCRSALAGPPRTPRALAGRLRSALRAPRCPLPAPLAVRAGWRCLGGGGRLALALPAVLHGLDAVRPAAAATLGCAVDDGALLAGFLRAWARDGDPNLPAALDRFGVALP